jgi:phosphomannomutase
MPAWSTRPRCASRSTRAASSRSSTRCSTGSRPTAPTVDRTDGARVNTADGWWLLRASNTQDVLVARAEAGDQEGLDNLVAQIDRQLALSGVKRGPQAGH